MNRSRITALVATLGSVAALSATSLATSSADARPADSRTAVSARAFLPRTAVHITTHSVVQMPTSLRPGPRIFDVTSYNSTQLQLVRLKAGYTLDQFQADVGAAFEKNDLVALNRFYDNSVFAGGVAAGRNHPGRMITNLSPGTYYAFDLNAENGPFLTLTVAGDRTTAAATWVATLTADTDKVWDPRPRTIPRGGLLRFRNIAQSPHFIEIDRLRNGVTYKQAKACVEGGCRSDADFGKVFASSLDQGLVSPGHYYEFKYTLPAGHYAVMCWMPDRKTGMPHAMMGMSRALTVK